MDLTPFKENEGGSPSNPQAQHDSPMPYRLTSRSEPNLSTASSSHAHTKKQEACSPASPSSRDHDPHHNPYDGAGHAKLPHNPHPSSSTQPAGLKRALHHSTRPSHIDNLADDDTPEGAAEPRTAPTVYTAYEAAQDRRAGASLVAWPPHCHYQPVIAATPPGPQRQQATSDKPTPTGRDDHGSHEPPRMAERSEQSKTGPYLALEAALDARRGACFVAWPVDEEWRVPALCV